MKRKRLTSVFLFLGCAILSGLITAWYGDYHSLSTPNWIGVTQGGIVQPLYSLSEPAFALTAVLLLLHVELPGWLRKSARIVSFAFFVIYLAAFGVAVIWQNPTVLAVYQAFGIHARFIPFTFAGLFLALGCYSKKEEGVVYNKRM